MDVYRTIRVNIAELVANVQPYGEISEYLFQQLMIDFNFENK